VNFLPAHETPAAPTPALGVDNDNDDVMDFTVSYAVSNRIVSVV
jgi:hypothetical protein